MAVGGALRAAIKAGNWASAARESRRRARALADLNARGGIRGRSVSPGRYLESRGVDVEGMLSPSTGDPYMDFVGPYPSGFVASAPRGGGVVVANDFGNRSVFTGSGFDQRFPRGLEGTESAPLFGTRNPIQAPYEGFRVWPYGSRPAFEEPRWRGAGRSSYRVPGVDARLYDDGFGSPAGYDYGPIDFRPYNPMPIAEMNVPRAFGGFDPFYSNNLSRTGRIGRTIPFDEIMAAQSSLIPPRPTPDFNVPF